MKQVIRNKEDSSISHVLYCIFDGTGFYLTDEAHRRMNEFSQDEVESFYSGKDDVSINDLEYEIEVLKNGMIDLLTNEMSVDVLRFKIAREIGFVEEDEILEIKIYDV